MGEINLYQSPESARPLGMPIPRLQLRWENTPENGYDRVCFYELVFPIREHDIRNEAKTGCAVVRLGKTRTGGAVPDWDNLGDCTPFRDGVHAAWDSKSFGGLPICVIAPNGAWALHTPRLVEDDPSALPLPLAQRGRP